jgi:hypothetical protein
MTYNMRRDQDSAAPDIDPDAIVISRKDDETNRQPYWYCQVLRIVYVFMQYKDINGIPTRAVRMDVLSYESDGLDEVRRLGAAGRQSDFIKSDSCLFPIPGNSISSILI